MASNINRWKPEEDSILAVNVVKTKNLETALRLTATATNRSVESCRARWYTKVSKQIDTNKKPSTNFCVSVPAEQPKQYKTKQPKKKAVSKSKHPRWSVEEDNCLRKQIELNINCLEDGFVKAARLTGRSVTACRSRWYGHTSLQPPYYFSLVSKGQQIINRRYPSRPSLIKRRNDSWWQKMMKLLGFSK